MFSKSGQVIFCCLAVAITTASATAYTCPSEGNQKDPEDNHRYYECKLLKTIHSTCPDQKIWDEVETVCGKEFKCTTDGKFKDEGNPEMYYECKGNVATHVWCPDSQIWDDGTKDCKSPPSTFPDPTTTEKPAKNVVQIGISDVAAEDFVCKAEGYFVDPKDNHKYHHCIFDQKHKVCPDGALWDDGSSICVKYVTDPPKEDTTTPQEDTTTPKVEATTQSYAASVNYSGNILLYLCALISLVLLRC